MLLWMLTCLALASDPAEEAVPEASQQASTESQPAEASSEEAADPAPEPATDVYEISVDDSDLGSALDDFDERAQRYGEESQETLGDAAWRGLRPQLFRGRWFIKPVVAWSSLQGQWAVPMGLAGGHQWFPASESPLQWTGETRLDATAPVGKMQGHHLQLTSTAGPWLGPIGIRLGPTVRHDRWENEAASLPSAFSAGARVTLGLDAGLIKPWVGIEPVWLINSQRTAWSEGIGELGILGGVQLAGNSLHYGLTGSLRQTSAGPLTQVAFTVHVRPR